MKYFKYTKKSEYFDIFASDTFFLRNKIFGFQLKPPVYPFPTLIPFFCLLFPRRNILSLIFIIPVHVFIH